VPLIILLCVSIHGCYIGSKIVVSLLALQLGASPTTIGVIAALYGVAPLILGVHSGRLSDRVGVWLPLIMGAGMVLAAMLTGAVFQTVPALMVVTFLMGCGFVYYNVSIQNLVGFHGKLEDRARNFSWLSMGYSTSAFVGPMFAGFAIDFRGHIAFAGFVIDLGGYATAFAGFALSALTAIALLVLNRGKMGKKSAPAAAGTAHTTFDLLRDPPLRRVVVMSGLMVAAWEMYIFYMPLHAHNLGLSASSIGLVLGVYSVGAFFVRFLLPVLLARRTPAQLLATAMLFGAAAYAALPAIQVVWLLLCASFVIGLVLGVCQPLSMSLAFDRSPAGRTGEVTGLRLTANNVARIIVPVIAGLLGTTGGAAPVFWMNAMNLLAVSWLARR
jgi:MFS family permease